MQSKNTQIEFTYTDKYICCSALLFKWNKISNSNFINFSLSQVWRFINHSCTCKASPCEWIATSCGFSGWSLINSWPFVNLSSIILLSRFQVIWATHFNISIMRAQSSTLIPHLPSYLLDCEHSGWRNVPWLAGPLSSTSAPLRACRPLTATQLLIFSLQPVLCLCLCLFCRAFQYTLLGSSSCINVTILFILRAAWRQSSARLNCYSPFCNLDLKRDSPYRQVITLETLTTLRLADHRCCVCMQRTTVFIVLGST